MFDEGMSFVPEQDVSAEAADRENGEKKQSLISVLREIKASMSSYGESDPTTIKRRRLVDSLMNVVDRSKDWSITRGDTSRPGFQQERMNLSWLNKALREKNISSRIQTGKNGHTLTIK